MARPAVRSLALNTHRSRALLVMSSRLLPRELPSVSLGLRSFGSWRVLAMIEMESDRLRPAPPSSFWRMAAWVRRTAVRKIDRKVSVSTAASMASWKAGRNATACWLPLRASCSVRRLASSRRTAGSLSMSTVRSLNVALS